MKLRNPFKPQLVEFGDGSYGVRKLSFLGYFYVDNMGLADEDVPTYWWPWFIRRSEPHRHRFETPAKAKARVLDVLEKKRNRRSQRKLRRFVKVL